MTVYDLIKEQINNKADRTAITFKNISLNYRQLNEEINKMASYLINSGIGQGDIVGISLNRSHEMVIALLGIIKIGAIYIPLDPDFPANRLKYMLEDSDCRFLITENSLKNLFHYYNGKIISVEDYRNCKADEKKTNLIEDKNVVYILYTSGSTGNPKGVQITHESLVNFLLSMQKTPGLSDKDTLLAITTLSFDISGLEIYLPLITGAQLIVASKEETKDGSLLLERVKNVSVMQATPSTWKLLLESGWNKKLNLKALCGGEALTRVLADKLLERVEVLWNMYGPTETTIWSSCSKVEPGNSIIHLGRPIANTQFYIVDKNNRFCPLGIAGELLIGGKGLSVGYLKREQLTIEKFIANPFDKEKNTKVYKTGDLVKLTANKELEYLGRIDSQVKIRGFRIELGEIETLIMQTNLVKDCTVVVKEFNDNDKKIVAFYLQKEIDISDKGNGNTSREQKIMELLRNELKNKLPEYMIPSYFIKLDSFPLTPNNKVDRKTLCNYDISELVVHNGNAIPQTTEEKIFVQIWENLLGIHNIGIDDNFFELGGHSILAAQMFAEFEKLTGKKIPLATLFTAQSIRELSKAINNNKTDSQWSSLVEIKRGESEKNPLFLVHGAEGNVLLYRDLGNYLNSGRPVYGLQSKGLNGFDRIAESVEEMAEDYIKAIKTVQPNGPYYLGGYCMGGTIAYEMAQQLKKGGDEVNVLFLIETYNECLVANGNNPSNKTKDKLENIKFHFDNIKSLKGQERTKFIRNKAETSLGRTTARISKLTSKVGLNIENKPESGQITLSLRKANDQAQINYIPDTFYGKAVLLRPKVSFSSEPDPKFGWGEYVKGELKIYNLDVAPRGMIVDPYVKETAKIIENEF